MDELNWLPSLQDVNVNHLLTFVAVADLRSFRAAATQMHLSQSALSVHIKQLEDALGVPVFHRTTRSVRLSDEGQALYAVTKRLVLDVAEVAASLREEAALQRGVVTVAVVPSLAATLLPAVMREFQDRHPGVLIRLRDADSHRSLRMIRESEVDLGVLARPRDAPDVDFRGLFTDPYLVVVPAAGHALSVVDGPVPIEQLAGADLLLNPRDVELREQLERLFRGAGRTAGPVQELTSTHALLALVGHGFGVTVLPRLALIGLDTSGCRTLRLTPPAGRDVGVVRHRSRSSSPPVLAVAGFLLERAAGIAGALLAD